MSKDVFVKEVFGDGIPSTVGEVSEQLLVISDTFFQ